MGVSPNHPLNGIFHYKQSSDKGVPFMEPLHMSFWTPPLLTPARRHRIAGLETQRAPSILTGRRGKTSTPWRGSSKWKKDVPNISKPPTSYFLVSYMMTCYDSYIPLHNYTSMIIVYH
jgi:hypothetical protein